MHRSRKPEEHWWKQWSVYINVPLRAHKRIAYKYCPLFYLLPQREKRHKPALPVNMCPKAAATLPALVLVVMHTRKCSGFCFLCQSFCAESVGLCSVQRLGFVQVHTRVCTVPFLIWIGSCNLAQTLLLLGRNSGLISMEMQFNFRSNTDNMLCHMKL